MSATNGPGTQLPVAATVLVAYATRMGGTKGIAEVVADELRAHGLHVDIASAGEVEDISQYVLVVLGSALYMRRWRPEAVRFLRRHREQLRGRRVALFQSGPCGPDAVRPEQPEPANVGRLRAAIDTDPPVTFGGVLDPATARGFLAKRMSRGELAGDFRDMDSVRQWAAGIVAHDESMTFAPAHPEHSRRMQLDL